MDQGGSSPRSDLVGGAGWMVFGLAIVIASLRMDRFTSMGATLYTMPGLVPGLFGGLLVVLGGVLALRGWRKRRVSAFASRTEPAGPELLSRRVLAMLVLTLGYAIGLVGRMPFAPATALFLALFMVLFAPREAPMARRIATAVLTSLITTAVIVLVFERVFLVRLP